jgi:hypothetical protein
MAPKKRGKPLQRGQKKAARKLNNPRARLRPAPSPAAPVAAEPRRYKTATGRIGVAPDVKRSRIFRIATAIAAGEWNAELETELTREWKLAPPTVRHMIAEASRIVDYHTGDRAKLVSLHRLRLSQIAGEDGPDRVQAIRTSLEHLGELRKRVEVSGPSGGAIPVDGTARVVVLPPETPVELAGQETGG